MQNALSGRTNVISVSDTIQNSAVLRSPIFSSSSSSPSISSRTSRMSKGAILAPQLIRIDFAVLPETSCQGLFNTVHKIFKKSTQQKPGALWLPACSCGAYSCAIIWRTSSRSIRLIFSSMVSVLVSLKCAHTR